METFASLLPDLTLPEEVIEQLLGTSKWSEIWLSGAPKWSEIKLQGTPKWTEILLSGTPKRNEILILKKLSLYLVWEF